MTHQFLSLLGVVVNEWLPVQQGKDAIGRELCLGVVRSKSRCLAHRDGPEDDRHEDNEDVLKLHVENAVGILVDQETSETEDYGVQEEDDGLGEGVGEAIGDGVDANGRLVRPGHFSRVFGSELVLDGQGSHGADVVNGIHSEFPSILKVLLDFGGMAREDLDLEAAGNDNERNHPQDDQRHQPGVHKRNDDGQEETDEAFQENPNATPSGLEKEITELEVYGLMADLQLVVKETHLT